MHRGGGRGNCEVKKFAIFDFVKVNQKRMIVLLIILAVIVLLIIFSTPLTLFVSEKMNKHLTVKEMSQLRSEALAKQEREDVAWQARIEEQASKIRIDFQLDLDMEVLDSFIEWPLTVSDYYNDTEWIHMGRGGFKLNKNVMNKYSVRRSALYFKLVNSSSCKSVATSITQSLKNNGYSDNVFNIAITRNGTYRVNNAAFEEYEVQHLFYKDNTYYFLTYPFYDHYDDGYCMNMSLVRIVLPPNIPNLMALEDRIVVDYGNTIFAKEVSECDDCFMPAVNTKIYAYGAIPDSEKGCNGDINEQIDGAMLLRGFSRDRAMTAAVNGWMFQQKETYPNVFNIAVTAYVKGDIHEILVKDKFGVDDCDVITIYQLDNKVSQLNDLIRYLYDYYYDNDIIGKRNNYYGEDTSDFLLRLPEVNKLASFYNGETQNMILPLSQHSAANDKNPYELAHFYLKYTSTNRSRVQIFPLFYNFELAVNKMDCKIFGQLNKNDFTSIYAFVDEEVEIFGRNGAVGVYGQDYDHIEGRIRRLIQQYQDYCATDLSLN